MDRFHDGSPFGTRTSLSGGIDFEKMWEEAKSRWLRPTEIYDILTYHNNFPISKEPLNLPPSGTLILFDRKMLRNFRRDGHPWRKKKDNKTVKEAHEHLKVGSEEKIHVYYAHGDGESNLQRRVYWLLDKTLEHIVLVHYLEVKEGVKANSQHAYQPSSVQGMQPEQYTLYKHSLSSLFTDVEPVPSLGSSAGPASTPQLDFSEFNSNGNDDFDKFSLEDFGSTEETGFANAEVQSQLLQNSAGEGDPNTSAMNTLAWDKVLRTHAPRQPAHNQIQLLNGPQLFALQSCVQDTISHRAPINPQAASECQDFAPQNSCLSSLFENTTESKDMICDNREYSTTQWPRIAEVSSQMSWLEGGQTTEVTLFEAQVDDGDEVLRKLDSLDRWMQRELPVENKTSALAASDNPCSYLDTTMHEDGQGKIEQGTYLAWQSPVTEKLKPSFLPQLFFEITDYSPSWSFVSEEVKVIVTGLFSGDMHEFYKIHWCCMFGDVEVPAEIVQLGVLRCKSPEVSSPGKVSFSVTYGRKQACSDLKIFELRSNPESQKQTVDARTDQFYEDAMLQCRLARLLLVSNQYNNALTTQKSRGSTSSAPSGPAQLTGTLEQDWSAIENLLSEHSGNLSEIKESLFQMCLKHKFMDWLYKKPALGQKSWLPFDKLGQTALHLASALGYEWVIGILMASGMNIDFRDKKGWTALHWAAYYGRERMVAALLAAGAKPGMVSDPTPKNPSGCTPADIAASGGYDGLAGYLSEQALTSHLELLTLQENDRDKQSADEEGHRVMEYLRRSVSLRRSVKTIEDELALEDSLSAIGHATTASARIHAAFREYSMRERLHAIEEVDEYGFSTEEQMAVQRIQKAYRNHRERKVKQNAALQIQNRYRVWKSRKEFLNLRQNVIKIQAYFRMHRARKQYHKFIWSVGVLEKAVLRWRQRRKGLRGYQPEANFSIEGKDNDDFLKVGRKKVEDSLDRAVVLVQSMVRSRLARQQYRRMQENFKQAKVIDYKPDTCNKASGVDTG